MSREQEILTNYRLIVMEIETLERQSKFLNKYIGGPRPVRSPQLTGMPRGTNDPEAAMLQRVEEDDPIFHIEALSKELREMMLEFEAILKTISDRRLSIIVRNYYALGWTDERIAEDMELSRQTVQKIRADYFNSLA
jgi:DNA-directed RNA polymerase specialized sigma24 family protein